VPYAVEFAQSVEDHFRALTARDRTTVLAAISRQLLNEPLKEARHRKPLRPNPIGRRGSYAWASFASSTRWSGRRVGIVLCRGQR